MFYDIYMELTRPWYPTILFLTFFIFVLVCFCYGIIRKTKKLWQSVYLTYMSFAMLIFAGIYMIGSAPFIIENKAPFGTFASFGIIPIPVLLNLHIRSQLSHKVIKPYYVALLFSPTVFLSTILIWDTLNQYIFVADTPLFDLFIFRGVFYMHTLLLVVGSYFYCLNALHHMPSHMRGSAKYMFAGITSFSLLFLNIFMSGNFPDFIPIGESFNSFFLLGTPITLILLLYTLFMAQNIAPAEDVIVTSRELVMDGLNTAVFVLNNDKKILDWNKNAWGIDFPLPHPEFMESMEEYRKRLRKLEEGRISPHNDDILIAVKNGMEIHFLLETHDVEINNKKFGYIAEITEVTSLYSALRYFEEIAHVDTLTGLYNRNAYFDYVKRVSTNENMPLLIFVGDVNYLKTINDTHGHMQGDELLKTIAGIIKKASPKTSFVARTGGDEFVVLVPQGNVAMASQFMQQIISQSEEINHEVFGKPSISWGYSIMKNEKDSYNEAFERADKMMYEYKRNRHGFRSSSLLPES